MSHRKYYRQCPECGANLDPGEICDCPGMAHVKVEPCRSASVEVIRDKSGVSMTKLYNSDINTEVQNDYH